MLSDEEVGRRTEEAQEFASLSPPSDTFLLDNLMQSRSQKRFMEGIQKLLWTYLTTPLPTLFCFDFILLYSHHRAAPLPASFSFLYPRHFPCCSSSGSERARAKRSSTERVIRRNRGLPEAMPTARCRLALWSTHTRPRRTPGPLVRFHRRRVFFAGG
jgi:hypothetical protein